MKNYVIISFKDKKPIKVYGYNMVISAVYDYQNKGIITRAVLYNHKGQILSHINNMEPFSI